MKKYDVIVVGGGASGIMTALTCAKKYRKVAIIDAGNFVGKKLLSTGNGKCNLTNVNMSSSYFNQNIDIFLKQFDEKDAINFFDKIGLMTRVDDCGRIYPFSNSAKSVVDIFQNKLLELGVDEITLQKVIDIKKIDNEFVLKTQLQNDEEQYVCDRVVLASGGNSLKEIAKKLGLSLNPLTPSLVALKTKESTKTLSGVRVSDVKISAETKNKNSLIKKEEYGEILFKDNGLSGIAILNLSTIFARNQKFLGKIFVDFVPKLSEVELLNILKIRKRLSGNILIGFLNDLVAKEIFNRLKINFKVKNESLTDENINNIAKLIKYFEFNIVDCYDNNQIYSGGICLSDLNEKLESKKVPNLFVCGELCDVDGETGGYNLQWAWTSGHIVGENI